MNFSKLAALAAAIALAAPLGLLAAESSSVKAPKKRADYSKICRQKGHTTPACIKNCEPWGPDIKCIVYCADGYKLTNCLKKGS